MAITATKPTTDTTTYTTTKSAVKTKARMSINMKIANPAIKNKEISEALGMAAAYVSQTLSNYRKNGATTAKAKAATKRRRKTTTAKVTRAAKVAGMDAACDGIVATTVTGAQTDALLYARSQISKMVDKIGSCAVKAIVADVTG